MLEIGVTGAASDGGGRGDRAPDRDVAARQDGGVRPRSELGPRADGGRLGALRGRLRAARHRAAVGRLRRRRRLRRRLADRHGAGARRRRSAGSISTSGSATAPPATSRPTSPTTTSGSTRSTRREPHRAQARRARRRRRGGRGARAARARPRRRRRPRGRPADHGRDGAARDRTDFRRRAARDDARGAGRRAGAPSPTVNAEVCAAIGPRRSPLFGDAVGLQATQVEALGLVGDPTPSAPARDRGGARGGPHPRGRAARRRPATVGRSTSTPTRPQPRSRSGSVPSGSSSSATCRGADGGSRVDHIAADDADRMLGDGTFEGGIVPKLEAAVLAPAAACAPRSAPRRWWR